MLGSAISVLTSPVLGFRKQVSIYHATEATGSGAQHRLSYSDTADDTGVSVIIARPEQVGSGVIDKDFGPIDASTNLLVAKSNQGFLERDKVVVTHVGNTSVAAGSREAYTLMKIMCFADIIWGRLEARAKE